MADNSEAEPNPASMADPSGDELDALIRGGGSGRGWMALGVLVVLGALAAGAIWWWLDDDESDAFVVEPQSATAEFGALTSTFDVVGVAASRQTEALTFGVVGDILFVVEAGDSVAEGDLVATLDTADLELGVQSAEVALLVAQSNLEDALGGASAVQIANAEVALDGAHASLESAQAALADLFVDDPDSPQIAAAELAVERAENDIATAQDHPELIAARAAEAADTAIDAFDDARLDDTVSDLDLALLENEMLAAGAALDAALGTLESSTVRCAARS